MSRRIFTNKQLEALSNEVTQFVEKVLENKRKDKAKPFVFNSQEYEENKNNKAYLKQIFTADGQRLKSVEIRNTRLYGTTINTYSENVIAWSEDEDYLYIFKLFLLLTNYKSLYVVQLFSNYFYFTADIKLIKEKGSNE